MTSSIRISYTYYHIYVPNDTSEDTFLVVFSLDNYQTIVGFLKKMTFFPYMLELCYMLDSPTAFPEFKPI